MPPVPGASDQIDAVLSFKSERVIRAVERVAPVKDLPGARALSTSSLSHVWELNLVLGPPNLGADGIDALFAACEGLQGSEGLAHRKLRLSDVGARDEEALAVRARQLGWRPDRELVMACRRRPDLTGGARRVQELDHGAVAHASDVFLRQEPQGRDPEVRRQLVAQYERWDASVAIARRVGIVEDGDVIAWCRLYEEHGITEIDDVSVLHSRRGEGLGRALMEGALAAVADDRLVFLCADPDDWPQQLYRRLGFEVVGTRVGATRQPR